MPNTYGILNKTAFFKKKKGTDNKEELALGQGQNKTPASHPLQNCNLFPRDSLEESAE